MKEPTKKSKATIHRSRRRRGTGGGSVAGSSSAVQRSPDGSHSSSRSSSSSTMGRSRGGRSVSSRSQQSLASLAQDIGGFLTSAKKDDHVQSQKPQPSVFNSRSKTPKFSNVTQGNAQAKAANAPKSSNTAKPQTKVNQQTSRGKHSRTKTESTASTSKQGSKATSSQSNQKEPMQQATMAVPAVKKPHTSTTASSSHLSPAPSKALTASQVDKKRPSNKSSRETTKKSSSLSINNDKVSRGTNQTTTRSKQDHISMGSTKVGFREKTHLGNEQAQKPINQTFKASILTDGKGDNLKERSSIGASSIDNTPSSVFTPSISKTASKVQREEQKTTRQAEASMTQQVPSKRSSSIGHSATQFDGSNDTVTTKQSLYTQPTDSSSRQNTRSSEGISSHKISSPPILLRQTTTDKGASKTTHPSKDAALSAHQLHQFKPKSPLSKAQVHAKALELTNRRQTDYSNVTTRSHPSKSSRSKDSNKRNHSDINKKTLDPKDQSTHSKTNDQSQPKQSQAKVQKLKSGRHSNVTQRLKPRSSSATFAKRRDRASSLPMPFIPLGNDLLRTSDQSSDNSLARKIAHEKRHNNFRSDDSINLDEGVLVGKDFSFKRGVNSGGTNTGDDDDASQLTSNTKGYTIDIDDQKEAFIPKTNLVDDTTKASRVSQSGKPRSRSSVNHTGKEHGKAKKAAGKPSARSSKSMGKSDSQGKEKNDRALNKGKGVKRTRPSHSRHDLDDQKALKPLKRQKDAEYKQKPSKKTYTGSLQDKPTVSSSSRKSVSPTDICQPSRSIHKSNFKKKESQDFLSPQAQNLGSKKLSMTHKKADSKKNISTTTTGGGSKCVIEAESKSDPITQSRKRSDGQDKPHSHFDRSAATKESQSEAARKSKCLSMKTSMPKGGDLSKRDDLMVNLFPQDGPSMNESDKIRHYQSTHGRSQKATKSRSDSLRIEADKSSSDAESAKRNCKSSVPKRSFPSRAPPSPPDNALLSSSLWTSTLPIFKLEDGTLYKHTPLPPGWSIKISDSYNIPYYIHPDFGRSYYPPVYMLDGKNAVSTKETKEYLMGGVFKLGSCLVRVGDGDMNANGYVSPSADPSHAPTNHSPDSEDQIETFRHASNKNTSNDSAVLKSTESIGFDGALDVAVARHNTRCIGAKGSSEKLADGGAKAIEDDHDSQPTDLSLHHSNDHATPPPVRQSLIPEKPSRPKSPQKGDPMETSELLANQTTTSPDQIEETEQDIVDTNKSDKNGEENEGGNPTSEEEEDANDEELISSMKKVSDDSENLVHEKQGSDGEVESPLDVPGEMDMDMEQEEQEHSTPLQEYNENAPSDSPKDHQKEQGEDEDDSMMVTPADENMEEQEEDSPIDIPEDENTEEKDEGEEEDSPINVPEDDSDGAEEQVMNEKIAHEDASDHDAIEEKSHGTVEAMECDQDEANTSCDEEEDGDDEDEKTTVSPENEEHEEQMFQNGASNSLSTDGSPVNQVLFPDDKSESASGIDFDWFALPSERILKVYRRRTMDCLQNLSQLELAASPPKKKRATKKQRAAKCKISGRRRITLT